MLGIFEPFCWSKVQ